MFLPFRLILALTFQVLLLFAAPKPSPPSPKSSFADSTTPEKLKIPVNEAANDLLLPIHGPKAFLRTFLCTHYELAAYQITIEYRFFESIPTGGSIHVSKLAEIVGMDVDRTGRFLRMLTAHRVFEEVEEDCFAHTAASIALAKEKEVNTAAGMQMDEMSKAASETSNAIRSSPQGATSNDSPFKQRFGLHTFDFYAKHPQKAARFAQAIASVSQIRSRVIYMKHNFFDPQPVHNVSAFFIRQCVHNWPDQECIKILRAFLPALEKCKPRTPLLINDTVLPKRSEKTRFEERGLRQLDIGMMVVLNAKQRTEKEFRRLLKDADERFEIVKVHSDGSMGLVEVQLRH